MELTTKAFRSAPNPGQIKALYHSAFPKEELLPWWILRLVTVPKCVELTGYYDAKTFCGFTHTTTTENVVFVMFFAVREDLRGQGYGSAILTHLKENNPGKQIVLNVERIDVPADNMEQRLQRLRFYEKNGFYDTGYNIAEVGGVFRVLSTGKTLDTKAYLRAFAKMSLGLWRPEITSADGNTFVTDRLLLRPWREEDAQKLYEYAKDPEIGLPAGWPPHQSVEHSLQIIQNVFSAPETYAVCLKDGSPIGSIGLNLKGYTDMTQREDECELGYWIGKPFWGQGMIPEAGEAILRYAFENLGMRAVWCGYYDGNEKSRRVQEKLGFVYKYTTDDLYLSLLDETRKGHTQLLTKEQWKSRKEVHYE